MKDTLYPIKFTPILKDKIWGGNKLKTILHKKSESQNTGESWEISDVEDNVSVVSNGTLKGQSLRELLVHFGPELLGENNYKHFGNTFPLLIKFIDAKQDLSIQLHPNDELAKKRHNSFGKTEMWYVMQADTDAKLIVGFNQKVTSETYIKHLNDKTLTEILNFDAVKEGDTYFIESGRVHAIGAGVLLAEIQQTSDVTYRVYDWDRVDSKGNARDLHNDLAVDAINFNMPNDFLKSYTKEENTSNIMVDCPYFKTSYVKVTAPIKKENKQDSFIIYMCVKGEARVIGNGIETQLNYGETLLMPAAIKTYDIISSEATLLEVYV